MAEMKPKLEISMEKNCIEVMLDQTVLRLNLDERGLPEFPSSIKDKLPLNITAMVEETINMLYDPKLADINVDSVLNPPPRIICSWTMGDGKLTCSICDESSTGYIRCQLVQEPYSGRWQQLWTEGSDRFYWIMEKNEPKTIACEDCLIEYAEQIYTFPDDFEEDDSSLPVFEYDDSSPDREQ
jgi:hypothetical protein